MYTKSFLLLQLLHVAYAAEVDCTGIAPYNSAAVYNEGQRCHLNKSLYEAPWYQQGNDPSASGSEWKLIGTCLEGTDNNDETTGVDMIDCSSYFQWQPETAYDGEKKWHVFRDTNSMGYLNKYWTDSDPSAADGSEAWDVMGKCKEGTMNADGPALDPMDCSGLAGWSGSAVYGSGGLSVHYEKKMYTSKYWTSAEAPSKSESWTFVAPCKEGTDSLPPPSGGSMDLTEAKKELLCSCCSKCAKLEVTGPVCLDDVATESDCYFAWCPKFDNYDETTCKDITRRRLLETYSGDVGEGLKEWPARVYVPYIDGGLAEQPKLSVMAETLGIKYFVVAFVVSGSGGNESPILPCKGGFASVIPPYVGPTTYNATTGSNDYVWDEVKKLRDLGGDITISFGGANGIEIADAKECAEMANPSKAVADAYSEVIDFLKLTHIDFDIEGNAYSDINRETGWQIRFNAVKLLEDKYPDLKVWWTLPILPTGLTPSGVTFISDMMASGVRWDRFNVMTMDYGDDTICPGDKMHQCEVDAITNLAQQFYDEASKLGLAQQYNWNSVEDVYPKLGSTPMIGQNDIITENYSLEDAKKSLEVWKSKKPIGIISNWSLTRDHPCGDSFTSCTCSSMNSQSSDYEFAKIFANYTSSS